MNCKHTDVIPIERTHRNTSYDSTGVIEYYTEYWCRTCNYQVRKKDDDRFTKNKWRLVTPLIKRRMN